MCVVYNCRNFGALLFGTNNRPEGGHDDPEPATDSTLLQKSDLQAHRSPPSGGSIVYLYQGRDWTVMAWDRVQPRSIESEATDVSPNHSPALTATKSRTSTAELAYYYQVAARAPGVAVLSSTMGRVNGMAGEPGVVLGLDCLASPK